MPATYGFAGWLTNAAALYLTFHPLEFRGVRSLKLGWQGIVPRRAAGVALKAVQTLLDRLVRVEELFARLEPSRLRATLAPVLAAGADDAATALCGPDAAAVAAQALPGLERHLEEVLERLAAEPRKAINLRGLALRNLTGENVGHLVHIFKTVGGRELRIIRMSGWVFGGLLGIAQAGIWLLVPRVWMLPTMGALVGAITNALALWLVFRPRNEVRIAGLRIQGLFHRRQAEVAALYASLFAERVITPRAVAEEALLRPLARATVDAVASVAAAKGVAGVERAGTERKVLVDGLVERYRAALPHLERLLAKAMPVERLIRERLADLPPEEFEPILRNAFREDEWILIALGGILGAVVGTVQALGLAL